MTTDTDADITILWLHAWLHARWSFTVRHLHSYSGSEDEYGCLVASTGAEIITGLSEAVCAA